MLLTYNYRTKPAASWGYSSEDLPSIGNTSRFDTYHHQENQKLFGDNKIAMTHLKRGLNTNWGEN